MQTLTHSHSPFISQTWRNAKNLQAHGATARSRLLFWIAFLGDHRALPLQSGTIRRTWKTPAFSITSWESPVETQAAPTGSRRTTAGSRSHKKPARPHRGEARDGPTSPSSCRPGRETQSATVPKTEKRPLRPCPPRHHKTGNQAKNRGEGRHPRTGRSGSASGRRRSHRPLQGGTEPCPLRIRPSLMRFRATRRPTEVEKKERAFLPHPGWHQDPFGHSSRRHRLPELQRRVSVQPIRHRRLCGPAQADRVDSHGISQRRHRSGLDRRAPRRLSRF
jgi:hypothetical protein